MIAIDERYVDAFGVERVVPQATRDTFAALLSGSDGVTPMLSPATVTRADAPPSIVVTLPQASWDQTLSWRIDCEDGRALHGSCELRDAPVVESFGSGEATIDRRRIGLGELPLGYHRIAVTTESYGNGSGSLIVVPPAAFPAPEARTWGIAVQLYTLRSPRNWGIGDFTDLGRFVEIAADAGARYVGLNPLHAPHRNHPESASPYAPTSRRFLNWLYIDIEALDEAADPSVRAMIDDPAFTQAVRALRDAAYVDYTGVARIKDATLRQCFAVAARQPADTPGARDFARFVADGDIGLERFAIFETLVERFGPDVSAWPPDYHDPQTPGVAAFAHREREAILFSKYLQYHAGRQFEGAAARAGRRGVALYRDLAVGVDANGADVWIEPRAYLPSVSVGAPPDMLNPDGQDWGLPPLDPNALVHDGYRTVADLFRANMHAAGALRIDHAMSLARLFWSPRGYSAAAGTYVGYPFEELLGVLALESVRAGCCIIGEDLGTVPHGFRERMTQTGVLSYRILFFEREHGGEFIPSERYPSLSLAATGTHDLAPFGAWLAGSDIDLRERVGIGDPARVPLEYAERQSDRLRLIATLRQSGDLDRDEPEPHEILVAAHRFLARSPARIVMMQIDDALGELLPVNVPGTSDSYPNWRRKLGVDIEAIATRPTFVELSRALQTERPRLDR